MITQTNHSCKLKLGWMLSDSNCQTLHKDVFGKASAAVVDVIKFVVGTENMLVKIKNASHVH